MGLSFLSKTKPSGGREEELRNPHMDVVVELDAKSGTTMGLSSLSKTKPSGGREEELRNPHLDVVVELDAK